MTKKKDWSLFILKRVEFVQVGGYVTGIFQRSVLAIWGQTDQE